MKQKIILFSTALILFFGAMKVSAQATEAIVKEYLSLYTGMKFDEIKKFYTEESVFEDPTTSVFDAGGNYQTLKGPKNITAFLKNGFNGISDIDFEINNEFTSGVIAFQSGVLLYSSTIGITKDGKPFQFELPLAIVLTIKNGKIIHHQDFADYQTWNRQYVTQLNKSKQ